MEIETKRRFFRTPGFCSLGKIKEMIGNYFLSLILKGVGAVSFLFYSGSYFWYAVLLLVLPFLFQSLRKRRNHKALSYPRK